MKNIWIITKKEMNDFFDSLMAYIMLVVFLGLSGFFTWLFGSNVFFVKQASLENFFSISYWTLFFFIPAITMRSLSEEKRSGTIEFLCTKSLTDREIVLGKFIACLLLICVALLATLPYYVTVSRLGNVDHGAVMGGYFGLLLFAGAYVAIGLFASSLSNNQIVSFLIALCISVFFQIIFSLLANSFQGGMGNFFDYLSMSSHFDSISRGVIDSRDIVYFLSLMSLGIFAAETMLSRRLWK